MNTLAALCVAVLALALWLKFGTSLPRRYRSRSCEGRSWRNAFPSATKQEIREFLLLFTSAFAFKETENLKFSPHDRIWEIYRELYPNRWTADALELETLTEDLLAKHEFSLATIWSEKLTLGEVFACIARQRA
jgi:hypothetical protein